MTRSFSSSGLQPLSQQFEIVDAAPKADSLLGREHDAGEAASRCLTVRGNSQQVLVLREEYPREFGRPRQQRPRPRLRECYRPGWSARRSRDGEERRLSQRGHARPCSTWPPLTRLPFAAAAVLRTTTSSGDAIWQLPPPERSSASPSCQSGRRRTRGPRTPPPVAGRGAGGAAPPRSSRSGSARQPSAELCSEYAQLARAVLVNADMGVARGQAHRKPLARQLSSWNLRSVEACSYYRLAPARSPSEVRPVCRFASGLAPELPPPRQNAGIRLRSLT